MSSFGSSAINKSTKKLAPKAPARRRPGAGPDGDTTSQAASQASARSSVDRQTPSATPVPPAKPTRQAHAPTVSEAQAQNEPSVESGARSERAQSAAPPVADADARQAVGSTAPTPTQTTAVASQQPIADGGTGLRTDSDSTVVHQQAAAATVEGSRAQESYSALVYTSRDDVEETIERSPKRRRIEQSRLTRRTPSPATTMTNTTVSAAPPTPPPTQPAATLSQPQDPTETIQAAAVEEATESDSQRAAPDNEAGTTVSEPNAENTANAQSTQARKKRALPKATSDGIGTKRTRQTASRAKGNTKAGPPVAVSDGEATILEESSHNADAVAATASAPTKKPRKAAKPRTKKTVRRDIRTQVGEGEDQAVPEASAAAAIKRKKRKKAAAATEGVDATTETAEDGAGAQRKKRGRKRAETPEDAASQTLDTSIVTMGDITRDPRIGKISEREEKIRKIDWAEVKRKRDAHIAQVLAQGALPTESTSAAAPAEDQELERQSPAGDPDFQRDIEERRRAAEQRARDAHAAKNGAPPSGATPSDTAQDGSPPTDTAPPEPASRLAASTDGPRLKLVNGQLVVEQSSLVIDRHAEAAADEATLEEVEEDDLTVRVNTRTWLNANKREPADRLPWRKADRWSVDETDAFYDALRMFGTDFFIISKMFALRTRRQVKMKFVREEKLDPDRVKAALVGETVKIDFQAYLERTNTTEADYRDPGELREELKREEEVQKEEIERTRREYAETMRQKRLAEGEEGQEDEVGKGGKKGKKKNKKKGAVGGGGGGGGEEVEVLETIDD